MGIDLVSAEVVEWAQSQAKGVKFHSVLCDPPYHLTTIVERFGKNGSAPAKYGRDGAFQRASRGFMGKDWDGGGVAFKPETWHAIGELMHDGAFGMAFGGSRTWHRMAVAIEDAGFVIHPTIFCWTYGSGFPKATRIDNQIDRAAGEDQPLIGVEKHSPHHPGGTSYEMSRTGMSGDAPITAPVTDLAKAWAGYRYGLQALKPAAEPIVVFQKPYNGRPIDNITQTGAGALNIDGGRIGFRGPWDYAATANKNKHGLWETPPMSDNQVYGDYSMVERQDYQSKGRWPANFILVHHWDCVFRGYLDDDYQINRFTDGAKPFGDGAGHEYEGEGQETSMEVWDCHPDCPVRHLDQQTGAKKIEGIDVRGDGGGSRYFHQANWELEKADPFVYFPKANTSERDAGLDDIEAKPLSNYAPGDPDEDKIQTRLHSSRPRVNPHPTVKPIGLARYLATLLLPPDQYKPRRILVPFAGVASEAIGAWQSGWDEIVAVEMMDEYCDIAQARIDYWLKQGAQLNLL